MALQLAAKAHLSYVYATGQAAFETALTETHAINNKAMIFNIFLFD